MTKLDTVFSAAITVAAVSMAGVYAYRTFHGPRNSMEGDRGSEVRLVKVKDAEQVSSAGVRIGSAHPKVDVIEFTDLECPFCRASYETVRQLMREHPGSVSYTLIYYPLPIHSFARSASRAAECARTAGDFTGMVDVLFGQQDAIGSKSWGWFAKEAGMPDTADFAYCVEHHVAFPAIQGGLSLGSRLGVRATPTVLVNGWRFERAPRPSQLEKLIDLILAGQSPLVSGKDTILSTMN